MQEPAARRGQTLRPARPGAPGDASLALRASHASSALTDIVYIPYQLHRVRGIPSLRALTGVFDLCSLPPLALSLARPHLLPQLVHVTAACSARQRPLGELPSYPRGDDARRARPCVGRRAPGLGASGIARAALPRRAARDPCVQCHPRPRTSALMYTSSRFACGTAGVHGLDLVARRALLRARCPSPLRSAARALSR
jgi:hypothetical protein